MLKQVVPILLIELANINGDNSRMRGQMNGNDTIAPTVVDSDNRTRWDDTENPANIVVTSFRFSYATRSKSRRLASCARSETDAFPHAVSLVPYAAT